MMVLLARHIIAFLLIRNVIIGISDGSMPIIKRLNNSCCRQFASAHYMFQLIVGKVSRVHSHHLWIGNGRCSRTRTTTPYISVAMVIRLPTMVRNVFLLLLYLGARKVIQMAHSLLLLLNNYCVRRLIRLRLTSIDVLVFFQINTLIMVLHWLVMLLQVQQLFRWSWWAKRSRIRRRRLPTVLIVYFFLVSRIVLQINWTLGSRVRYWNLLLAKIRGM